MKEEGEMEGRWNGERKVEMATREISYVITLFWLFFGRPAQIKMDNTLITPIYLKIT